MTNDLITQFKKEDKKVYTMLGLIFFILILLLIASTQQASAQTPATPGSGFSVDWVSLIMGGGGALAMASFFIWHLRDVNKELRESNKDLTEKLSIKDTECYERIEGLLKQVLDITTKNNTILNGSGLQGKLEEITRAIKNLNNK